MPAMRMDLSYHGAPFSGFARQRDAHTVQGELEHALGILLRREVDTVCAGRTDAGVHALGQVVSFELTDEELEERSLPKLAKSLNAITPEGIVVRSLSPAPPGFSARFDARSREYRYFICMETAPPVFMRDFSWHLPVHLDVDAMYRASRCLIGEHDFKSFCTTASAMGKPTCRNLMSVDFSHECIMGEKLMCITVVGSSFLHSMVRTLTGTLVAVGRGRRPEAWVAEALAARERSAAGETAPAKGLVFWHVDYGPSPVSTPSSRRRGRSAGWVATNDRI